MTPEPIISARPPLVESDFLDKVVDIVQQMITETKGLPPQLFLYVEPTETEPKPGICIAHFPTDLLNSGKGKDTLSEILKTMLKTRPSKEVVFVTEAWSARRGLPKELETMLTQNKMRLSQLPSKYRQEVIMLQYYDSRAGGKPVNWMGRKEFERDPDDNVINFYETEWVCMSTEGAKTSGRFTNLME